MWTSLDLSRQDQGFQVSPYCRGQDDEVARGNTDRRHHSRYCPTGVPRSGGSHDSRIPETVTTDKGAQFTSGVWKTTLSGLGVDITMTTSYHPQANGLVERFHRMLKNALRCAVRTSKSWTRSLPWVMLGLRNSPKLDTATSTAEAVFGTPLRVPGLCFQDSQSHGRSAAEELELARANARTFSPETLDLRRFKASLFVAKSSRTATFVYVRDDRLGKPSLAPRYVGPYRVVKKNWENNTFLVDLRHREDVVSLTRLKAATIPEEASWPHCWGEECWIPQSCTASREGIKQQREDRSDKSTSR